MGLFNFGHDILIYQMRKEEGRYLKKENEENIWKRKISFDGEEKRRQKYVSYFAYIFIGPRSDHSLPMSVTNWLTH